MADGNPHRHDPPSVAVPSNEYLVILDAIQGSLFKLEMDHHSGPFCNWPGSCLPFSSDLVASPYFSCFAARFRQDAKEVNKSFSRRFCPGVSILKGNAFKARST